MEEAEGFPSLGTESGLLSQLPPNGLEGAFRNVATAFGNLPGVGFQGVAPLAHQDDAILVIQGEHTTGRALEAADDIVTFGALPMSEAILADSNPG